MSLPNTKNPAHLTTSAPLAVPPLTSSMGPAPPQPPPLLLTIRFSAALPDLELDIPRPSSTTVVSLKHLIRSRLDKSQSKNRLRFIHGGKILPDTAVLSSVLRLLPPPPATPLLSSASKTHTKDPQVPSKSVEEETRGKGKSPAGNEKGSSKEKGKQIPGRPEPSPRIYINCSIGDELSASDLEHEAHAAALPPPSTTSTSASALTGPHHYHHNNRNGLSPLDTGGGGGLGRSGVGTAAQNQGPRGFDRLLQTGFTPSEVNQLRLQFRSIHASRYTPDTLPSPDTFRRMEDAWIDDNGALSNNNNSGGANEQGGGGGGGVGSLGGGILGGSGADSDEAGALVAMVDVLIRGVITGFVWPLGSAGWLMREENMSSGRWRFMVGVGVVFSLLVGCIRAISGDDK
ncbi:DUF2407 C-terminal domain-containing protein [Xylariaceae sp. FL0255]|nr:DUF2407 C-terminal domain-containing protein [Xylariaceae sp. FL0255]